MLIDLRSDTVTLPTDAMRAAMAAAEVGDDSYGEDPTVNRLEALAAERVGRAAALFVPSGTMGNAIALKCHTRPGQEALIAPQSHVMEFEAGGCAWISGVLPRVVPARRGILDPEAVAAAIRLRTPPHLAPTGVIWLENTHNMAGGTVYPLETLAAVGALAREQGVPTHMDGARVFNAAVAGGVPAAEICRHVDSVTFCFSKALSAPVGSVLCGSAAFIEEARRVRRVLGGGMRQAGILAAAALVALETMVERLADDHARARRLAEGLAELPGCEIDPGEVETNLVFVRLGTGPQAAAALVTGLRERGVLVSRLSADTLRLVTHRHIGEAEVDRALTAFREELARR